MDQTHVKDKDRNVISFDDFKKSQEKLLNAVTGEPEYGQRGIKAEELYVQHDANVYKSAGIKYQKKDADADSKEMAIPTNTNLVEEGINKEEPWKLNFNYEIDEIGSFWVVTKPTKDSTIADCCFSSTINNMIIQKQGGLKQEEIVGFFKDKEDAETKTKELISNISK